MKTNTITSSLLLLVLPLGVFHAQGEQSDPFRADPAVAKEGPPTISFCCEIFSLPMEQAAALMREMASGRLTDEDLHGKMADPENKEQVHQEQLIVMRGRPGQRISSESSTEHIYPKEYELPSQGQLGGGNAATPDETAAATPTTSKLLPVPVIFEMRPGGIQIELEPTLDEGSAMVDLALSIDMVELAGRSTWGQDSDKVELADFESRRLKTRASLPLNRPFLVGTLNRPAHSTVGPDSANRVWLVFVTTSKITP